MSVCGAVCRVMPAVRQWVRLFSSLFCGNLSPNLRKCTQEARSHTHFHSCRAELCSQGFGHVGQLCRPCEVTCGALHRRRLRVDCRLLAGEHARTTNDEVHTYSTPRTFSQADNWSMSLFFKSCNSAHLAARGLLHNTLVTREGRL